ncbi:MAG: glycoside hydrolase family 47 protein [Terracidiphilus sp.]|nr:glycoside hydrolase family 47 protein [Terracidiphilus sp.]
MCVCVQEDKQEPHFTAETLKYLYLLQSPRHSVWLKEAVFNSHGHLFRMGE